MVNSKRDAKFPVVPPAVSPRRSAHDAALRLDTLMTGAPSPSRLEAEFSSKKRKRGRRLFVDREILVKSQGRVSYVTLSRRSQLSLAVMAGVAAIALLGYAATSTYMVDRARIAAAIEPEQAAPASSRSCSAA